VLDIRLPGVVCSFPWSKSFDSGPLQIQQCQHQHNPLLLQLELQPHRYAFGYLPKSRERVILQWSSGAVAVHYNLAQIDKRRRHDDLQTPSRQTRFTCPIKKWFLLFFEGGWYFSANQGYSKKLLKSHGWKTANPQRNHFFFGQNVDQIIKHIKKAWLGLL